VFSLGFVLLFSFHEAHFRQANHMTELLPLLATMGHIHFEYLYIIPLSM
jgi:hypothetical protein